MLFITLKAHNHAEGKYRLIIHEYYFVLVHKQECIRCYRYPMGNLFLLTQQLMLLHIPTSSFKMELDRKAARKILR